MDKNAIKKYAVWARHELIERVSQRAMIYGITAKDSGDPNAESVNGHLLSQKEKRQRQALIRNIKSKSYEQVMEEVAYTWFNRFAALRFMEVNGYLPSHIRVFTNDAGEFKPQILAEAIHLELDGLDLNRVYELESANKSEELFKYLLIVQCNALNSILPGMFQRIDDYSELLLPDYLLREGSVIEQMVTAIPESDWTDQVQIIGWLYQYYNTEPKDKVFADLKKNIKITKENIPAATQLFTPDWIVRYMVENSLGRLWLEGHPNDALKSEWKYYLDEVEQEAEVQAQLDTIRKEYAALKPEEIRVIDPCMGSGHILCVLFDVLVRIYEDYGFTAREAATKIVEKNLWGLDIDERATQLSYFAVMMKARQYDRHFFTRKVQPHVYAIEESNGITSAPMHDMGLNLTQTEYGEAVKQAMRLVEEMHDAKEYGSIIHITPCNWDLLRRWAVPRDEDGQLHLDIHGEIEAVVRLQKLIKIAEAMAQKYHVVVTNPPYMGAGNMSQSLTEYVKTNYPDSKADLFAVFVEKCSQLTVKNGFQAMITQQTCLFIPSFEKLRKHIYRDTITDLIQVGFNSFPEMNSKVALAASFVIRKAKVKGYKGTYYDLSRRFPRSADKETVFSTVKNSNDNKYYVDEEVFLQIPGAPIAYWISENLICAFSRKSVRDYGYAGIGMRTGDNQLFLRLWTEISQQNMLIGCRSKEEQILSARRWIPYNKGGDFKKWYGNNYYVVNWLNDGEEIKENTRKNYPYLGDDLGWKISNENYYYKKGITWSGVSLATFSCRYYEEGFIFDSGANGLFAYNDEDSYYLAAVLNSCVGNEIIKILNPTINTGSGTINQVPVIMDEAHKKQIISIAQECIRLVKEDWDSFELSWDYKRHPLVGRGVSKVAEAFSQWETECENRYAHLVSCEEQLNRYFIDMYGLAESMSPSVYINEVSVNKANRDREIRSLISYAVGCMFGRYSIDYPGLVYAGGEWDDSQYVSFIPDRDAIIPICDDDYFDDDIASRLVKFIEIAFGQKHLEENLQYIAETLGSKYSARKTIREYFVNEFYSDHCNTYSVTGSGKRPIYWLFDSGKKNGFKCLIYMHRYQPDTIARIRTDYVHEQQSRYRTAIADLEQRINGALTSERVKLTKQLTKLQDQAEELRIYEEKIHHLADQMIKIDLDDGVKHNYEIFQDVLAKIK